MTPELATAVCAALRYDGIGNLTLLQEAAGLSGAQFAALRRGRYPISPTVARRLARTLRTWAEQCERRAARIAQALQPEAPDVQA